jgi:hypothetical protein
VVRRRLAGQLPRARAHEAGRAGCSAGRRRGGKPAGPGVSGHGQDREHWHAPVGDRRTIDRLTQEQRAFNRLQAGLRALVEQSVAHLANAWSLRRWRDLLYRVRDVFRAAGALICLAAGCTEFPRDKGIMDTLNHKLRQCSRSNRRSRTAA